MYSMTKALAAPSIRFVSLLLLSVQGAAWAQAAAPAPLVSDRPEQPPAASAPPAAVPAYVPPPMSKQQRELQRRLSLRHYALMGAATVLTGGGVVFGLQSRGSIEKARSGRYQVNAQDSLRASRQHALIANAAFLGAGAALVGAVVTYFISPPTPPPEDPSTASTRPSFGDFR